MDVIPGQQRPCDQTVPVDVDVGGERERDWHRRVVAQPVPESIGLDPGAGEQHRRADHAGGHHHRVRLDGGAVGEDHSGRPAAVEGDYFDRGVREDLEARSRPGQVGVGRAHAPAAAASERGERRVRSRGEQCPVEQAEFVVPGRLTRHEDPVERGRGVGPSPRRVLREVARCGEHAVHRTRAPHASAAQVRAREHPAGRGEGVEEARPAGLVRGCGRPGLDERDAMAGGVRQPAGDDTTRRTPADHDPMGHRAQVRGDSAGSPARWVASL